MFRLYDTPADDPSLGRWPKFSWRDIRPQPMAKRGNNLAGFEAYLDFSVMGTWEPVAFDISYGMGEEGKAKEANGVSRGTYEKRPTVEHASQFEAFKEQFIQWYTDHAFEMNPSNAYYGLANRKKKFPTREKLEADIRRRLRGPVKEASAEACEKHPQVATQPFTIRYKVVRGRCKFTTRIYKVDSDRKIAQGPDGHPALATAAELKQYSSAKEMWRVHIMDSQSHIDMSLLTSTIMVQPEEQGVSDLAMYGVEMAPYAAPAPPETQAFVPASPTAHSAAFVPAAGAGAGAGAGAPDADEMTKLAMAAVL